MLMEWLDDAHAHVNAGANASLTPRVLHKSLRHSATISVGCYGVVTGLLFTLGTQAQVGARPKKMETT
jgi:hypothetical protein